MNQKTNQQIRIKSLEMLPANSLIPDPDNWRRHPNAQREVVRDLLQGIGYASALIARRDTEGNLHLIDGHLRAEISADEIVPVLITDLTEDEAKVLLVSLDTSTEMASTDFDALQSLVESIPEQTAAVMEMLNSRAKNPDVFTPSVEVAVSGDEDTGTVPYATIRVKCPEKDAEAVFTVIQEAVESFEDITLAND